MSDSSFRWLEDCPQKETFAKLTSDVEEVATATLSLEADGATGKSRWNESRENLRGNTTRRTFLTVPATFYWSSGEVLDNKKSWPCSRGFLEDDCWPIYIIKVKLPRHFDVTQEVVHILCSHQPDCLELNWQVSSTTRVDWDRIDFDYRSQLVFFLLHGNLRCKVATSALWSTSLAIKTCSKLDSDSI